MSKQHPNKTYKTMIKWVVKRIVLWVPRQSYAMHWDARKNRAEHWITETPEAEIYLIKPVIS